MRGLKRSPCCTGGISNHRGQAIAYTIIHQASGVLLTVHTRLRLLCNFSGAESNRARAAELIGQGAIQIYFSSDAIWQVELGEARGGMGWVLKTIKAAACILVK